MYDPVGGSTNEFVELFNPGPQAASLSGYYFSSGITYSFGANVSLAPGGYLVIAAHRAAFAARYPAVTNLAAGVFAGQLANSGERLALCDATSNAVFDVTYNNSAPWPAAAAGLGSSLVLADPFGVPGDPSNWQASAELHGSPGGPGGFFVRDVVINEVLAHTDPPQEDAVELRNLTTNPVSVAGWFLSDDNAVRKKYRFPSGSTIPAGGYLVVYQSDLNGPDAPIPFSVSSKGDDVFLSEADSSGVIVRHVDQVEFEPTKNGVSVGRYPDGAGTAFIELAEPTFGALAPSTLEEFRAGRGARNAGPYVGPVVISEVMYHPVSSNMGGRMEAEYIELYNRSPQPVPLFNPDYPELAWSLTGGVSFEFPTNLVLQPGERLVVAGTNDLGGFRASWNVPPDVFVVGPFSNSLDNAGDTVRLRAPNNPEPGTNAAAYHVEERVGYDDRLPWPLAADGLGGSLERTDPASYADTAANWHSRPGVATPGTANSVFVPPGAIVISEIMAVNRNTIRDEDGDFSDWIELYNTTDRPVSLAGWHLTDTRSAPALWTFPDVTIPARGNLLVFASQKDRTNDVQRLHTNFALDAAGEYLALFRDDLALEFAFDPAYPPQQADIAYGIESIGGRSAVPVRAGSAGRYLVPASAGALASNWTARAFDDSAWKPAGNGIGYDTETTYLSLIQTDLKAEMLNKQNAAFVRFPFVVTNSAAVNQLRLRVKYEDGFGAWLNGVPVASGNLPAGAGWNSKAAATRSDTVAVVFEEFDLNAQAHLLADGTNVLALQVLNTASNSSDLLLLPELGLAWAGATGEVDGALGYLAAGTPGSANGPVLPGAVAEPALSHPGGVITGTVYVAISCATAGAGIRYTLDGMEPTTNSSAYAAPIAIAGGAELRARAFLDGRVPSPLAGAVYRTAFLGINEILASNVAATPEMADYTDYGDWIEIYNGGPSAVDLGGYHLSDSASQPFRWPIPAGTVVPAGGHLLVWADGGDLAPGQTLPYPFWPYSNHVTRACHANFKLSADGEELGLFSPSGSRIDAVSYGLQQADISCGRVPDGSTTWRFFGEPTPAAANAGPALTQNLHRAPKTTIGPAGPLFTNGSVTVTLSSDPGATAIRYTTDGAVPTSASPLYTNAFTIATSAVIRARAYAADRHPGPVATRVFLIGERTPDLPVLSIVTDPGLLYDPIRGIYVNTLKEREIPAHLQLCSTPTDTLFRADAGIRIFGLNSFLYAQKPFTVYLDAKYGQDLLGCQLFPEKPVGAFDRFVLRNGNDDWKYAYLRDPLGVKILEGVMANSQMSYKPTAAYLNGAYYGLLDLREKLDEMYFVRNYGVRLEDIDYFEMDGTGSSADPMLDAGTDIGWYSLVNYATTNSLADAVAYSNVCAQVDLEDLADFVSGQAYLADSSWFHNRKWWRDRGPSGRWRWCFFDMDRTMLPANTNTATLADMASRMEVFRELLGNPDFKAYFAQRLAAHLNSSFRPERVIPIIDREADRLRSEMPYHIAKYAGQGGIASMSAWEAQLEGIRQFARARPAIVMNQLASLLGAGGTVPVAVAVADGDGQVLANHVPLAPGTTNAFLAGVPVHFRAQPALGQAFVRWEIVSTNAETLVGKGSVWKYNDAVAADLPGWTATSFNDAAWLVGAAQLGYGDGDEATVIGYGPAATNKYPTAYFRKSFGVTNASQYAGLELGLLRDDGAAVYLNGVELLRSNLPAGALTRSTLAVSNVSGSAESSFAVFSLPAGGLVEGVNVLAVEIHQDAVASSDLSFDLYLAARSTSVTTQYVDAADLALTPTAHTSLRAVFAPGGQTLAPAVVAGHTTFTAAQSPWVATGDIFVPSNATLSVEAGTTLLMPDGASVRVQGRLELLGAPGSPVRIEANPDPAARTAAYSDPSRAAPGELSPRWGGISFERATAPGLLSNVVIRSATLPGHDPVNMKAAVSALDSDLFLHGLDLDDVRFPVFVQNGNSTVLENSRIRLTVTGDGINIKRALYARVENCEFSGAFEVDADAIDYDGVHGGIIRGNFIHDFMGDNDDAIDIGEEARDLLVESNRIVRCSDKGVSIGQASTALVRHNVIRDVALGAGIKDRGSLGRIENNTFHGVDHAVAIYEKNPGAGGGGAEVRNSIFSNCALEPVSVDPLSTALVSHCLSDSLAVPGEGNRTGEPRFENAGADNFRLQTGSPAIDAGSLLAPPDADGSRADIGAVAFDWRLGHAVINEIQYHPAWDGFEFIELYNPGGAPLDLSGWRLSQGIDFVFPAESVLPAKGYLLLAELASGLSSDPSVHVWTSGQLDNAGDTIRLLDPATNEMDKVSYGVYAPWPSEPDGTGASLSLIDPRLDNARSESWHVSRTAGGTPGTVFDNQFPGTGTIAASPRPGGMPGSLRFAFPGLAGLVYVLERTEDLVNPDWQPAGPAGQAVNGNVILDLDPPSDAPQGYYRVRVSTP